MKFPFVLRSTYDRVVEHSKSTGLDCAKAISVMESLEKQLQTCQSEDHARKQIITNLKNEIESMRDKMLVRGNYEMTRSLYYFLRRMMSDKVENPENVIEIFNISGFHKLGSETRKYLYQGLSDILYGKNNTRNKEEI